MARRAQERGNAESISVRSEGVLLVKKAAPCGAAFQRSVGASAFAFQRYPPGRRSPRDVIDVHAGTSKPRTRALDIGSPPFCVVVTVAQVASSRPAVIPGRQNRAPKHLTDELAGEELLDDKRERVREGKTLERRTRLFLSKRRGFDPKVPKL